MKPFKNLPTQPNQSLSAGALSFRFHRIVEMSRKVVDSISGDVTEMDIRIKVQNAAKRVDVLRERPLSNQELKLVIKEIAKSTTPKSVECWF